MQQDDELGRNSEYRSDKERHGDEANVFSGTKERWRFTSATIAEARMMGHSRKDENQLVQVNRKFGA